MRVSKPRLSWCDPNQQKLSSEILTQGLKNVKAPPTFNSGVVCTVYNKHSNTPLVWSFQYSLVWKMQNNFKLKWQGIRSLIKSFLLTRRNKSTISLTDIPIKTIESGILHPLETQSCSRRRSSIRLVNIRGLHGFLRMTPQQQPWLDFGTWQYWHVNHKEELLLYLQLSVFFGSFGRRPSVPTNPCRDSLSASQNTSWQERQRLDGWMDGQSVVRDVIKRSVYRQLNVSHGGNIVMTKNWKNQKWLQRHTSITRRKKESTWEGNRGRHGREES